MTQDPLAFQVFNEISILDQLAGALFDSVLPKGMTRAQFGVLNHFVRLDLAEQSPAALARAFQVTRPTMTSTLARMERHGLISVSPDPADGRAKRVSLTPQGRAMRATCIAALASLLPTVSDIVSETELADMLPRLRTLRVRMDARRNA